MDEQRQLILDQFTRQAAPFAEMHARDDAGILNILLDTAEITSNDTVLDVACGPGLVACEAAKRARHVTGLDLTPAMIVQAKARQESLGLTNIDWVEGDAQPLPFPEGAFSRVITRYAFHHFTDPRGVFAEMKRVCCDRITVCDVYMNSPEQAAAYDQWEKYRDPSHTHALLLSDFEELFADLKDVRKEFYWYPVEVDDLLSRAFPDPGGAGKFRQTLHDDISINRLGVRATPTGFSFPVLVISGVK